MSIHKRRSELLRLQKAFENEAGKFHEITLSIVYLTQTSAGGRAFRTPNHGITLWQYYGSVSQGNGLDKFMQNLAAIDWRLGILQGSEFCCFAVVEGPETALFVRMANRIGSLFSEREAERIRLRTFQDFATNAKAGKPVFTSNGNPLALWLNFVLHHLGNTHPRYLPETRLGLDPFAASLSAIDALLSRPVKTSAPNPSSGLQHQRFQVALSFPGEHRTYVEDVADALVYELGAGTVFYDRFFEAELARPNLDLILQDIYHNNSDLVAVFLCQEYANKEWCGLEWRAIRDLIKKRQDERIILLRFDNASIPGLFGVDGYVDLHGRPAKDAASAIAARIRSRTSSHPL